MSKKFENGLFIFRRDLRMVDNHALYLLGEKCNHLYTIFIFTPEQVGNQNSYKSDNSVQFMIESLDQLASVIAKAGGKLHTFYGENNAVVAKCIQSWDIDMVAFNLDYTPYARNRDKDIIELCEKKKTFVIYDYDYYLHEPDEIVSGSGKPYQKFTPYYNTASKKKVQEPMKQKKLPFSKGSHIDTISLEQAKHRFVKENPDILVHGGRINAIRQLKTSAKYIQHYDATRNTLAHRTSELSAYIKFGCVSIREVYKLFRSKHGFIRQLYWRDFYAQLLYHYPYVIGHSMKENYRKIKWHYNAGWFEKWCEGKTGFPIVDAGIRQMNQTGYMHNRARLIVANFLVKTLLIDWRHGEKYFATQLVDYDVANNNLNWQWCASTAVDSQPYFRIFNPWLQQKEYDPKCEYIKRWIPELANIEPNVIHHWGEDKSKADVSTNYPKPICNYEQQKEKALAMYKAIY